MIIIPELFEEEIKNIETAANNLTFNTDSLDFGKNNSFIHTMLTVDQIKFATILKHYQEHMEVFTGILRSILEYFVAVDEALGSNIEDFSIVEETDEDKLQKKVVGDMEKKKNK